MKKNYFWEIQRDWALLKVLIERDIKGRYKGSIFGMTWTMINPLMMLSIYTLIFSQVFNARWGSSIDTNNTTQFSLNLFCGLIVFNIFSECATRATTIITSNPNYIKKVVFPIHILGAVVTGSALIHGLISTIIIIIALVIAKGYVGATVLFLPIVMLPFMLGCLGMTWILSTIGVFMKDITQIMNALVSMMMFISPIFYPTSALPEKIRWLTLVNPLSYSIETIREVIIEERIPSAGNWMIQIAVGMFAAQLGFVVLEKARKYVGDYI